MKYGILFLLITAILVCPFRCMSSMASVGGDESGTPVKSCSCCSQPAEKAGNSDGPADSSDDGCPNCLCHGAVNNNTEVTLSFDLLEDTLASLELALMSSSTEAGLPQERLLPSLKEDTGGYALCIRHCALLV
ncbi:MAG: hypothetical protein ACE37I_06980 [Rubinisphaera brasiliensis]|uniref:hypothetical protein n=1 Tax=Rubinisphaera brasiliensis TaxID=119 RepID=UPI003918CC5B